MTKHTLVYFGLGGRAEPIRLAFVVGGKPFTNKAIGFPEFQAAKPTLPLGQVPVLDIEDDSGKKQTLCQSNAILRYVGKSSDLYPSDPIDAMKVDMFIDTIDEAVNLMSMTIKNAPSLHIQEEPWPKEQIMEIRARLMDPSKKGSIASTLKILEDMLVANGTGWFVGDKPTIADLKAHQMVSWFTSGILDGVDPTCLDAYPTLKALRDKIEALPSVVDFREKHGTKYTDFDYVPN